VPRHDTRQLSESYPCAPRQKTFDHSKMVPIARYEILGVFGKVAGTLQTPVSL